MNLYVTNLSTRVEPADLNRLFSSYGLVLYAQLANEAEAGGEGFACVYIPDDSHARDVVTKFDGLELKGTRMLVRLMPEQPGVVRGTRN